MARLLQTRAARVAPPRTGNDAAGIDRRSPIKGARRKGEVLRRLARGPKWPDLAISATILATVVEF